MKSRHHYLKMVFCSSVLLLTACSTEAPLRESELDVSSPPLSSTDQWIATNLVTPYNIRVIYRWNQNATNHNQYLVPPKFENVVPVLKKIKRMWLDSFVDIGRPDMVKKMSARELVLVGGRNMLPGGNFEMQGLAEVGQRITLFEVDRVENLDLTEDGDDFNWYTQFLQTIVHENIHILNNNIDFDKKGFQALNELHGYRSDWNTINRNQAVDWGFITPYAMANVDEDFAETTTTLLLTNDEEYTNMVWISKHTEKPNPDEYSYKKLMQKKRFIENYFKEAFKIDFNKLRATVRKNVLQVVKEDMEQKGTTPGP
jgi:substrate import-associated zinc metallohydrolase lipoprotein